VDETEVWEQGVGHVLVEERRGGEEVEGYSVWTVVPCSLARYSFFSCLEVGRVENGEGEGEAVGRKRRKGGIHLHGIELLFLGYNLVDVRCEEGVRGHDLVADRALDGGFYFAL
jgi:hypothetical protein